MGDPTGGNARAARTALSDPTPEHLEEVTRIAESVLDVSGADGALVSRVLDDDWLEVVVVAGSVPARGPQMLLGTRWRRADLAQCLADAERQGRRHVTRGGALPYVALRGERRGVPGSADTHDLALAPLRTSAGELLGVVTTIGRTDADELEAGACELIELYAEQARLALSLLRDNLALAEQLRLSDAGQSVLSLAAQQRDVPALLAAVAPLVADMLRARGVWICAELVGVHTDAASYPGGVAESMGPDVCALVGPLVDTCRQQDVSLSDDERPVLGRIAGLAHHDRALLASIGRGTTVRGAVLVMRDGGDRSWTDDERAALCGLGRRLGVLVHQLEVRRRDQEVLDELRQLDQYRRDLVASITHDLRTPLTAITLNTELLESAGVLADIGPHPVAAIRRSAERLSRLVDDLLALARAEEQIRPAVDVDVVALVRQACRDLEVEATARGVRITVDAPATLQARVDAEALRRVYSNVVGNAVKYSLPQSEVRIRVALEGVDVAMVCQDHGIGIPEEEQGSVFDMVPRRRERTDGVPGAGIGLAISQRIVTRLGGGIALTSTPGRGSTFTVRVPVSPAAT